MEIFEDCTHRLSHHEVVGILYLFQYMPETFFLKISAHPHFKIFVQGKKLSTMKVVAAPPVQSSEKDSQTPFLPMTVIQNQNIVSTGIVEISG